MREHHLPREAEPDPGALRLGGEEGQEDVAPQFLGHARAIVGDLDPRPRSLGAIEAQRQRRVRARRLGRLRAVAQQVDQHLHQQIGIGVEREVVRPRVDMKGDPLRRVAGVEQGGQFARPRSDFEQPPPYVGRAADLAIAFDEMHHAVGAARERLDRGARVGNAGIVALVRRRHQIGRAVRERGHRRHRVHDLVGEHADQVALRGDLDRVELALDRLHPDRADHPAQPMDHRDAHHHRLRHRVERDRHEPRLARLEIAQRGGERVAIFGEILDPHALVAQQQPARGLVGELDPAAAVDRQQARSARRRAPLRRSGCRRSTCGARRAACACPGRARRRTR